jgi:hypothetical protein
MADSPQQDFPGQFNPNNPGDPDATRVISNANNAFAFQIRIAARTLDNALSADRLYFDHGHSTWIANFAWPVVPGVSIVAFPAGSWQVPGSPAAFNVDVVPTVTNHSSPFLRWIPAKYIDYTPDITSEDFWRSHEVEIVRVVGIDGDAAGEGQIRVQVIQRLNSAATEPEQTFAFRDLWFSPDPEDRMKVQAGDTLVLYIGADRPIVAQRLTSAAEESSVVQRLERISQLSAGETDALSEAALHPDPWVAQYTLKRLIADPETAVSDPGLTQLRQTRDDQDTDPQVRLLAAALSFQREGKSFDSDDGYKWLQTSIAHSTLNDWTQIAPFVRKLTGIEARRSETIPFLVGLATDEQAPESVRIAAYSGFEALIYDAAPPEAEEIIQACLQLLHSQNPVIRRAGASLLYNFSVRGGRGPLDGLSARALSAIRAAHDSEPDEQVRSHLQRVTELLSGGAAG